MMSFLSLSRRAVGYTDATERSLFRIPAEARFLFLRDLIRPVNDLPGVASSAPTMNMMNSPELFLALAAAFVRGRLMDTPLATAHSTLFQLPLNALTEAEMHTLLRLGTEADLKLHKFKR